MQSIVDMVKQCILLLKIFKTMPVPRFSFFGYSIFYIGCLADLGRILILTGSSIFILRREVDLRLVSFFLPFFLSLSLSLSLSSSSFTYCFVFFKKKNFDW